MGACGRTGNHEIELKCAPGRHRVDLVGKGPEPCPLHQHLWLQVRHRPQVKLILMKRNLLKFVAI